MKLVVLGANGRTGIHVVQTALEKGITVTAVVRSANKKPKVQHDQLKVCIGDPCDTEFLKQVLRGQDAMISTLGGRSPTKFATSVYYRSADAIVAAAWETSVKRVLVTSTALLFPKQTRKGKILRRLVPNVVRSATQMEEILKASGLTWTSARPGFLNDSVDGSYRAQKDSLPKKGTSVSRRALANFLIASIEEPEAHCAVFGVSDAFN